MTLPPAPREDHVGGPGAVRVSDALSPTAGDDETRAGRLLLWICRYLPAEVAGTASMIVAGVTVTYWTEEPGFVALAALLGGIVGFSLILAVTVFGEQIAQGRLAGDRHGAAARTLALLIGAVGPAELLDTLLVRPVCLVLGVWLVGEPVVGLLLGKIVADTLYWGAAAASVCVRRDGRSPLRVEAIA